VLAGVSGAVAKALKDSNGRAMLAGYCIMDESAKAAVRDHCKRVLLPAMVPGILIAMASFPRLPNGKTDVNSLPEPDWTSVAAGEAYVAPVNPMEERVQALWQRVLQVSVSSPSCCCCGASCLSELRTEIVLVIWGFKSDDVHDNSYSTFAQTDIISDYSMLIYRTTVGQLLPVSVAKLQSLVDPLDGRDCHDK